MLKNDLENIILMKKDLSYSENSIDIYSFAMQEKILSNDMVYGPLIAQKYWSICPSIPIQVLTK